MFLIKFFIFYLHLIFKLRMLAYELTNLIVVLESSTYNKYIVLINKVLYY